MVSMWVCDDDGGDGGGGGYGGVTLLSGRDGGPGGVRRRGGRHVYRPRPAARPQAPRSPHARGRRDEGATRHSAARSLLRG